MALSTLPYRYRLTSKSADASGTGFLIGFDVLDGDGALRAVKTINVGGTQTVASIEAQIHEQIQFVLAADSGSTSAFLDAAVTAVNQQKAWALANPPYQPASVTLNGLVPLTWTNQPSAITEAPNSRINRDLTLAVQARICVNVVVAGFAGARLGVQFSTDGGTVWNFLDGGTGPNVLIDSTGPKRSAFVNLVASAKADVLIRGGGQGGNAVLDPQFSLIILEFR